MQGFIRQTAGNYQTRQLGQVTADRIRQRERAAGFEQFAVYFSGNQQGRGENMEAEGVRGLVTI